MASTTLDTFYQYLQFRPEFPKSATVVESKKDIKVLCITFSSCNTYLAIGTTQGFIVFSVYPLQQISLALLDGGIGLVSLLWEKKLVLLVGGGKEPAFPRNEL
jgi:hypothetical protein